MELRVKRFDELTPDELYAILRLRTAVFVVEQNCPYLDPDGRDRTALHVWLEDADGIAAYLRVTDRDGERGDVSVGRVIAARRRQGLGSRVLREGIRVARERFGADRIRLDAQVYAQRFYELQGFRRISEPFLEDGIPHVRMLRAEADTERTENDGRR